MAQRKKIVVIGGCGHVGLPLGVKFALAGAETVLIDIDENAVRTVNNGKFPFLELGGDAQLRDALKAGLRATTTAAECSNADVIVFVTGTPVDEHLNPKLSGVTKVFEQYEPYFTPGVLVVMRSTLFPGTMNHLHERLNRNGIRIKLAFCPERVSQGFALDEIDSLPQVVSAFDDESFEAAYETFSLLAPEILRLTPLEAEITKLMANSWRYLEFAIANQFFMIAERSGVDFFRVYQAIKYNYPRAKGYKCPGFAAGPCLFKDTMQLASYFDHQFYLGHSAMLVNEGLASFVVDKAKADLGGNLWGKTVAILGMAFKADNDDTRESLSFRVKKGLEFDGATVLCHDPYLKDSVPLEEVLERADIVVLGVPHSQFAGIEFRQPVVDVWNFYPRPSIEILPGKQPRPLKSVANV
jgi:UDP-N-acetyl-D-mannosaminuronic acid dehydrogenase